MIAIIIGAFFGAFGVFLVIAAIWLMIAEFILLRKQPKVSHYIAMSLVVLVLLVKQGGADVIDIFAAAVCIAGLVWRMKHMQSKIAISSE